MENQEIKVTCYIYALADSADNIRYIGATSNPKLRHRGHICEGIRVNEGKINSPTKKQLWVAGLLREGKEPTMKILEECDSTITGERELFHYDEHAGKCDLLCASPKGAYKYNRSSSIIAFEARKREALAKPKVNKKVTHSIMNNSAYTTQKKLLAELRRCRNECDFVKDAFTMSAYDPYCYCEIQDELRPYLPATCWTIRVEKSRFSVKLIREIFELNVVNFLRNGYELAVRLARRK